MNLNPLLRVLWKRKSAKKLYPRRHIIQVSNRNN